MPWTVASRPFGLRGENSSNSGFLSSTSFRPFCALFFVPARRETRCPRAFSFILHRAAPELGKARVERPAKQQRIGWSFPGSAPASPALRSAVSMQLMCPPNTPNTRNNWTRTWFEGWQPLHHLVTIPTLSYVLAAPFVLAYFACLAGHPSASFRLRSQTSEAARTAAPQFHIREQPRPSRPVPDSQLAPAVASPLACRCRASGFLPGVGGRAAVPTGHAAQWNHPAVGGHPRRRRGALAGRGGSLRPQQSRWHTSRRLVLRTRSPDTGGQLPCGKSDGGTGGRSDCGRWSSRAGHQGQRVAVPGGRRAAAGSDGLGPFPDSGTRAGASGGAAIHRQNHPFQPNAPGVRYRVELRSVSGEPLVISSRSASIKLDLRTRRHHRLDINSDQADSWHCWSSNSR